MDTVRVSITVKVEYDLHPENYPVMTVVLLGWHDKDDGRKS